MKNDYDVEVLELNPPIGGRYKYYSIIFKNGHHVKGEWHGETKEEARDKAWKKIRELGEDE